ncbi:pantetheine-phosphate adenylyltransferase [Bartonella ancashensis]|uniref:Phosphopantetheine adenylyltransferase n=1 Tax=Bartonella ancashensis TaxID=1318743 RepID=A0A0M4M3R9_9HYPH|nr:pantetheine-phosphate adenylyltransferase [Bartonella ancashensis]ALE03712.1 Phosphopantetheine adenylyltransferase [Bartonella ancashensis]
MVIALYAGSFDPITNGHLSVLKSSFLLADRVFVAVGVHGNKHPLFRVEERIDLIMCAGRDLLNVSHDKLQVISFDNLLIDKAREIGASLLVRGLREGTDFDYEMQMAGMNRIMAPELQTVFLPADVASRMITSTLVRQVAAMGGDVTPFVPQNVAHALRLKFKFEEDKGCVF